MNILVNVLVNVALLDIYVTVADAAFGLKAGRGSVPRIAGKRPRSTHNAAPTVRTTGGMLKGETRQTMNE